MRLFIGIPFDNDKQAMLYESTKTIHQSNGFRFVKPDNYHITLHFLGETSLSPILIADALRPATERISPFTCKTDRLIGFPGIHQATSLGISLLPKDPFIAIQNQFQLILNDFGFKPGKSMNPHITIARMKIPVDILALQNSFQMESIFQVVSEIAIYQSILQSAGAIYHQLVRLDLKGETNG